MREKFCLKTAWNSYVYRGLDGSLFHHHSRNHPVNFFIELDLSAPPSFIALGDFKLPASSNGVAILAEFTREGSIALKAGAQYLSADAGGVLSLQNWRKGWELFSLVRVADAGLAPAGAAQTVAPMKRAFSIPKLIHQTSKFATPPSQAILDTIEPLKSLNRGWVHHLWSDKDILDFIYDQFGYDILSQYLRINPRYGAARADLFRYLCVYKSGGVYLDIKSTCTTPLDAIVRPDDQYLLSQWDERHRGFGDHAELSGVPGGEYQQWHVIAAPGHPFLERVINDVLKNIANYHEGLDGVGRLATLRTTGPISYTKSIHGQLGLHPHRFIDAAANGLVYRRVVPTPTVPGAHYSHLVSPLIL